MDSFFDRQQTALDQIRDGQFNQGYDAWSLNFREFQEKLSLTEILDLKAELSSVLWHQGLHEQARGIDKKVLLELDSELDRPSISQETRAYLEQLEREIQEKYSDEAQEPDGEDGPYVGDGGTPTSDRAAGEGPLQVSPGYNEDSTIDHTPSDRPVPSLAPSAEVPHPTNGEHLGPGHQTFEQWMHAEGLAPRPGGNFLAPDGTVRAPSSTARLRLTSRLDQEQP